MGFFKRLKKRLLTLNYDPIEEKKVDKTKVSAQEQKLKKVEQKKQLKELRKQQKEAKKARIQIAKKAKVDKYVAGLQKSNSSFGEKLKSLQTRYHKIDEDYFEELEEALLMADVGVNMTLGIIDEIKKEVRKEQVVDPKLVNEIMVDKLFAIYVGEGLVSTELNLEPDRLNIILVTGVNGVGKTTTIAKLVNILKNQEYRPIIAAADTFRAGAVEQLSVWASRLKVPIVKPIKHQQDPASVVFQAIKEAKARKTNVLLVDTAGRLQNKVNLMAELAKIKKVIRREVEDAPHETILVMDATTGQNGISQAVEFKSITDVSSIILTKMDGTSKGGIIFAIKEKLNLPVKYMGLGERIDDLVEFDLDSFVYGLVKELIA